MLLITASVPLLSDAALPVQIQQVSIAGGTLQPGYLCLPSLPALPASRQLLPVLQKSAIRQALRQPYPYQAFQQTQTKISLQLQSPQKGQMEKHCRHKPLLQARRQSYMKPHPRLWHWKMWTAS